MSMAFMTSTICGTNASYLDSRSSLCLDLLQSVPKGSWRYLRLYKTRQLDMPDVTIVFLKLDTGALLHWCNDHRRNQFFQVRKSESGGLVLA